MNNPLQLRRLVPILFCFLSLCFYQVANAKAGPSKSTPLFAYGADIGWLSQLESYGIQWENDEGEVEDALQILKDHGINAVRLRVFVDPDPSGIWYKISTGGATYLGFCDKDSVIKTALRAKKMGMRILLDFHYSEIFADPSRQQIPAKWVGLDTAGLEAAVYDHTYDVISSMVRAGVVPDWAQVGNEINYGVLRPAGSTDHWEVLTALLNSGYDAVKAASPTTKVVTHVAKAYSNSVFSAWFANFLGTYGGKTDIIGGSTYSWGDDLSDDVLANFNDMVETYGKDVMVVETGGPETRSSKTYTEVIGLIKALKNVEGGHGLGVFYWEPEGYSTLLPDAYAMGATKMITDDTLMFTHAIDAFSDGQKIITDGAEYTVTNRQTGQTLHVVASTEDTTTTETDDQTFYFVNNGYGFFNIENVADEEMVDVTTDNAGRQDVLTLADADEDSESQQWIMIDVGNGFYKIRNHETGTLLGMKQVGSKHSAMHNKLFFASDKIGDVDPSLQWTIVSDEDTTTTDTTDSE